MKQLLAVKRQDALVHNTKTQKGAGYTGQNAVLVLFHDTCSTEFDCSALNGRRVFLKD